MRMLASGLTESPSSGSEMGDIPAGGVHAAFVAQSRSDVDAFYCAALSAGGKDNGPPGPRLHYHSNYYGAFVLDPDGNNIEAVCHRPV
jgi:predicted lactoylglutathione lyase